MPELTPQPTPIQAIYDMYKSKTIVVNRTYQRKLVWTLAEKRKLIDSMLCKYPIPLILLSETRYADRPGYEVIDGLQRLHSIVSFIENRFSLDSGEFFDVEQFAAAKNAAAANDFEVAAGPKLSAEKCARILSYILSLSIMRDTNETQIRDVFNRINSYGHRLSEQERRQAGLVTKLASLTRNLACAIRGDVSKEILLLSEMPEISIDLPMSKHGFGIQAEDCFWVKHGILRSTDLRDSMDEHLIADIICCIVNGEPIERSVHALDSAYDIDDKLGKSIDGSLFSYGSSKISDEIMHIISLIETAVSNSPSASLRRVIFKQTNTNAYPSVFAVIFMAIYRIVFKEEKDLIDKAKLASSLSNIASYIDTGRGSVSVEMRSKNIDCVYGLINQAFGGNIKKELIYGHPSIIEFENIVRNSPVENACLEFKQGILRLDENAVPEESIIGKLLQTICAIANIGPDSAGHLFIGIADKKQDALRVEAIDGVIPLNISDRYIVGVEREAKRLNQGIESYFTYLRDKIRNSELSDELKQDVLKTMKLINYHGRIVVDISVPPQKNLSFLGEKVFYREADQTKLAPLRVTVALTKAFS